MPPHRRELAQLVDVAGGRLALTHRPRLAELEALGAVGVTHVVTLLSEREGAQQLGDAVRAAGLTWIWIPFAGGGVPTAERSAELVPLLDDVAAAIRSGRGVMVHCSAGIHRTGMVGNAVLRRLGLSLADARAKLAELRQVTAEGVGADRLAWGDGLAL